MTCPCRWTVPARTDLLGGQCVSSFRRPVPRPQRASVRERVRRHSRACRKANVKERLHVVPEGFGYRRCARRCSRNGRFRIGRSSIVLASLLAELFRSAVGPYVSLLLTYPLLLLHPGDGAGGSEGWKQRAPGGAFRRWRDASLLVRTGGGRRSDCVARRRHAGSRANRPCVSTGAAGADLPEFQPATKPC